MFRSFPRTIFILIAGCLLMTLDCPALRAQEFSSTSGTSGRAPLIDKQLSDIPLLVRESDRHGALMHRKLNEYTYTLVKIKRTLNDHGKVTSEQVQTFEAYPVQGQHVLIQLTENGLALPSRAVEAERKIASTQLEWVEREAQKQNNKGAAGTDDPGRYLLAGVFANSRATGSNVMIDLSEFLRSCEFSAPRRERVGTREAIALSFSPRADVRLPVPLSFISKLTGTIWIDVADKVVVRLEGWPLPEIAPQDNATRGESSGPEVAKQAEAAIIYQQVRLPTGLWVPSLIRMNARGHAALFNGLKLDVMFEFSEYKRFSVDVGGVGLEKPNQ